MHVVPHTAGSDVLFPARALLPLSAPDGGQHSLRHFPGALRPLAAALGVTPVEGGKHDTTASRWTENMETQKSAMVWSSRTLYLSPIPTRKRMRSAVVTAGTVLVLSGPDDATADSVGAPS